MKVYCLAIVMKVVITYSTVKLFFTNGGYSSVKRQNNSCVNSKVGLALHNLNCVIHCSYFNVSSLKKNSLV